VIFFNLADTYFVSQLGTEALAAMSFTFPVVMVLFGVSFSLSTGTASVVSRAIGSGDESAIKRLASDSLTLSFIVVGIVAALGMATIDPLFTLMGAGPEILPLIRDYMFIWYPGIAFLVVPMVANASIRAAGDTKFPTLMMVGAMVTNLALDPIMIFGLFDFPRMELKGAAWATVISRGGTMIAALAILHFRERLLDFRTPTLAQVWVSWKAILGIAVPVGATNLMQPVAMAVVTRLIAQFGPAAVAAWGAGERVTAFALIPVMAVCSALVPLVGQNWGAQEYARVNQARRYGYLFSLAWGVLVMGVMRLVAAPAAAVFSTEPGVLQEIRSYLWIMPFGYALYGVLNVSEETLNAIGRPLVAALQTLIHMFLFYAPLALLGAYLFGFPGLLWGVTAANLLGGAVAYGLSQLVCLRGAKS
jgi:putative MATE family efflux protein